MVRQKNSGRQLQCSVGQLDAVCGTPELTAALVQPERLLAALDIPLPVGWLVFACLLETLKSSDDIIGYCE